MRRIVAGITGLLLAVFGAVSPALATPSHNCPDDTVCLYQWISYGAPAGDANPGWKSSFYNLSIHSNGCVSLLSPYALWPNGTPVADNSAALVVNGSGAYSTNVSISLYGWDNCSSIGGVARFNANWTTNYYDLHLLPIGNGITAYHNIESIQITSNCGPPGTC